jgi:hypothetical protein
MKKSSLVLAVGALLALACSSGGTHDPLGATPSPDAGAGTPPPDVTPDPVDVPPKAGPADVEPDPTNPKDDANHDLGWAPAPLMTGVLVVPNRDSAIVVLPVVQGAIDYRVITVPDGVKVSVQGGAERIDGSTIHCAGYRQHNAPRAANRELLRQVEVTGLTGATRLVVEAIDTACPYVGALGSAHVDITATNPEIDVATRGTFSFFTEAEVRAAYGSLIVNGHGNNPVKAGQPAPATSPKVLSRTTLKVTPLGTALPGPTATFFDDFQNEDPATFVANLDGKGRSQAAKLYQNSKYSFYTYGAGASQFFFARGQMHFVLADWEQDIMSSNIAYPRKPVALSDTDYLHVTYEVHSNATDRRYWWMLLCGADTQGATMGVDGKLKGNIIETPFFMESDGQNPSVEGWNCLQVFPRQGWPFALPPDNTNPESEVRVMVNKSGNLGLSNVVNTSPMQYPSVSVGPPSWFRTQDAKGNLVGKILDDQQLMAPRTRFDVFVRRDRVVLYVNGEQRICNELGLKGKLTMAEGALGFGQVYYHSAAERDEFNRNYWDRRGQRYYLENSPFVDVRSWDNVGYDEHVGLPNGFDASVCATPKQ